MSLRKRLTLIVLALMAVGMIAIPAAAFGVAREAAADGARRELDAMAARLGPLLENGALPAALSGQTAALIGATGQWFIEVRSAEGRVLRTVSTGRERLLVLPPPKGQPLFTKSGGNGKAPVWWVRSSWLPDGRILAVGTPSTGFDDLSGRIVGVVAVITTLVLLALAIVAYRMVSRVVRPLEEIAVTAKAIGEGDLTRRVEPAEDRTEAGRLGLALNAMLGHIEAAFHQRTASEDRLRRFIADASHELRTPVAAIRGYAELFRRGAATRPDDLATTMARIESEATRMGVLVDELLLLARLDQGRPLEREPVDLAVLATEAVAAAHVVEPGRPLSLEVAPAVVYGDAVRLRQVLDNLLANVRQHTPPGTPATVRVAEGVIEVGDEGPGLAPEDASHVFERFYRVDASRSRSRDQGGVGLGLAIVAAVAQAHGGAATVVSLPGRGATFSVRIPPPGPDIPGDG
ncbi:sensor histidine kinase [Nonomuraea sp. NPDC050556]|uniref:sensor histidine kinase n=1 Tax=Nonomuraea sp. NPDC050556 TaxID=3364369 RepID=UPI0037A0D1F5